MWYRFLLVIIIFITAAGNLLVCLAIARERKLQNTTNYFLMSLAVADCLVAVLVMPIGMISEVLGYFPLPHYACAAFATIDVLCCTSSIWHMSTMSMDRYFTIRFPFRYGRNKTRRIMLLKIIAVWAISAAISSPILVLGIFDKRNVLHDGNCAPNNSSFKIYGSIFAFYIPFLMMITTYALTMRSLRNVLVNKKKYDRERRRKQTFRPLAQIINQYAEIAQGIRRTSSTKKSAAPAVVANAPANHTSSMLNKPPYTIITSTSPTDTRAQFFAANPANGDAHDDAAAIGLANGSAGNTELFRRDSQHLSISYLKRHGSKKRRYRQEEQQQALAANPALARVKNPDMSTVYEITEYSKSTSSSYDVSAILGSTVRRKSLITNEMQVIEQAEPLASPPATSSKANEIAQVDEEEASFASDPEGASDAHDTVYVQIASASRRSSLSCSNESIFLTIPWKYCISIIEHIRQYYIFYFPYRFNPRALEHSSRTDDNALKFHQSTSTSSIRIDSIKKRRSIATQTNPLLQLDIPHPHTTHVDEAELPRRRKFTFNRQILSSSTSLLTNLFRYSPGTRVRLSESSSKSTVSFVQRSSAASSSNPTRHPYSPTVRQNLVEIEPALTVECRPRASTSSSYVAGTSSRQRSQTSSYQYAPLRRHQYHSQSAYALTNLPRSFQGLSSTTNTNSSDSSSMMYRYHSKLLSTMSNHHNHHRVRVEDIVAANERKALRVLMIIFCVFITLWTPFFICTLISAVCEQCRTRLSADVWFSITWLGYSSSMANPFIYTIFSDVFRRAFVDIIFCRSNDLLLSRQLSSKSTLPKGGMHKRKHERMPHRRYRHQDVSGTSTPIPMHYPALLGGSDAMIYVNRGASDTFR